MNENPIAEAAARFRGQLITGQNDASNQMLDAWADVIKRLSPRLAAIMREIEDDGVTTERLFEQERLERILADVAAEVEKYVGDVDPVIAERQREAIDLAQKHAKSLTLESLGPAPPGARATWSTVDPGTLENLVGLTAEGSPFADELAKVAGTAVERVRAALLTGFTLGRTPTQILSSVNDAVAGHVGRFLTVARTAEMHAYTLSQFESFQENSDVIKGWRWHSSLSFDTCLACLALHGREFPMGAPMERHFNCRCMAIPITKSWAELGYSNLTEDKREWPTGEDWLESQPRDIQERALGKTRLHLLESGEVQLDDFLGHADYPQWGGMFYERSTQNALASARARDILFDQSSLPRPSTGKEAREALKALQEESALAVVEFNTRIERQQEQLLNVLQGLLKARTDGDPEEEFIEQRAQIVAEIARLRVDQQQFLDNHHATVLEQVVFVDNPSSVQATSRSRFNAKRQEVHRIGMDAFNRMVDASLPPAEDLFLLATREKRASYYWPDRTINCPAKMSPQIVAHEAGHWLERHNPDVQRKAFAFYDRRTAGSNPVSLRKLTGIKEYKPWEVARLGGFPDFYMGKEYFDLNGNRVATEIVSMGMEWMYAYPEQFARVDPDYFDFIFDLLRGL